MASQSMQDDDTTAFDQGVSQDGDGNEAPQTELEDVKKWFKAIEDAKKFDSAGLRGIAQDRQVLQGRKKQRGVNIPIALTYIDILESYLYTRNPTVQVDPSAMTEPPPQKAILAKCVQQILAKRQEQFANMQKMAALGKQAAMTMPPDQLMALKQKGDAILKQQGAGQIGGFQPPPEGSDITNMQPPQTIPDNDPEVQQLATTIMQPYQQKRDDAKQFAGTMEVAIQKTWDVAGFKKIGKQLVNAGLSVAVGYFKASWQERMGQDPTTEAQVRDIKEQIAQMTANAQDLADNEGDNDANEKKALLQQQLAGIEGKGEVVVKRGFKIEAVAAQDIQISTEVPCITDYLDAAWIAHYTYPTIARAKADYPDIADKLDKATDYYLVRPKHDKNLANPDVELQYAAEENQIVMDAFEFRSSNQSSSGENQSAEKCVKVIEIYDRTTTNTITLIDGLTCYAKQPYVPKVESTRGIPIFQYVIGAVNGQRWPKSKINQTAEILDEYNETRTTAREMRRRGIPKTAYNRGNLTQGDVDKIAAGTVGEMVGLDPINPETPVAQLLAPIAYNQFDPALADTTTVRSELEQIWGVAEALSGATVNPQTATEAELQNNGTHSRLGKQTDDLDDVCTDFAQYTGEVLLQTMDAQDIEEMCGPWALWPEGLKIEDMGVMLQIAVKAGSSGKPSTAMQQQAWGALLPQLKESIIQIGQLRGSSPDEIADCIEALVEETARRVGDRIDVTQFIPDAPRVPPPPPAPKPRPQQDMAFNGPQIAALSQVLIEVRSKAISEVAGMVAICSMFPTLDPAQVAKMVKGAEPKPGDPPTQIDSKNVKTNSPDQKQPGEANPNPPPAPPAQPAQAAKPAAMANGANGAMPAVPPAANGAPQP